MGKVHLSRASVLEHGFPVGISPDALGNRKEKRRDTEVKPNMSNRVGGTVRAALDARGCSAGTGTEQLPGCVTKRETPHETRRSLFRWGRSIYTYFWSDTRDTHNEGGVTSDIKTWGPGERGESPRTSHRKPLHPT